MSVLQALPAHAQSTIRAGGPRPRYHVELEPHFVLGPFDPPGPAEGEGIGVGARATFEVASEGFIASINDSVGVGVGLDYVRYDSGPPIGRCTRYATAPNDIPVCVEIDGDGGDRDRVLIPLVMQWNFWLARRWSVFGEPGAVLSIGDDVDVQPFALFVGGRYHFNDSVALTLRIGHPTLSFGASFLF